MFPKAPTPNYKIIQIEDENQILRFAFGKVVLTRTKFFDNDEFKLIDYDGAVEKFNAMFEVVKRAGLYDKFKKIFRPPAWRMSPAAIKAAKDSNFDVLALASWDYALKSYAGEDKNFNKVVYETCCPPLKPLVMTQKTEIVYHACEWDRNYLSKEMTDKLSKNMALYFLRVL